MIDELFLINLYKILTFLLLSTVSSLFPPPSLFPLLPSSFSIFYSFFTPVLPLPFVVLFFFFVISLLFLFHSFSPLSLMIYPKILILKSIPCPSFSSNSPRVLLYRSLFPVFHYLHIIFFPYLLLLFILLCRLG
jgi:hypothetical protein